MTDNKLYKEEKRKEKSSYPETLTGERLKGTLNVLAYKELDEKTGINLIFWHSLERLVQGGFSLA